MKENKSDIVVEMVNIQKSFGELNVLKDINLKVKKGETVVVLGKSGSGKSVLIKCIVRLLEADEGKVSILGSDIYALDRKEMNNLRMKIGFLFQSAALYDSLTVRENLEFPLRRSGKPQEEIDKLVMEVLENVGLGDAVDLMPSELSGGMRKRIGLARSMIFKPEIMLYDEPTTGLDPVTAKEISHLILEVQKKYNTTSIIITHDLQCARITANRMMVLKDGVFVAEGTFDKLEKSKDKWVHSFFE
ncbi:MAG: ATP-binding cassette domain-containing protein [Chitinophagaceae bacterium]|nr:MAG: ATP-binding cassette domain-containing protein [Chitinophagaceae bacterium]